MSEPARQEGGIMEVHRAVPDWTKHLFSGLIVAALLVGFVVVTCRTIVQTIDAPAGNPPEYGNAFTFVASAVTAFVGGIFAAIFGVEVPTRERLARAGGLLVPLGIDWEVALAFLYVLTYMVVGFAAVVVWVANEAEAPTLLVSLASTAVGLSLAIGRGFFEP